MMGREETDTAAREDSRTLCISARRAETASAARGHAEPPSEIGRMMMMAIPSAKKSAVNQTV
jgi:hypothetical protein